MRRPALKKVLLTGSCLALLTGCSWLEEWNGGPQAKAPQPQPQMTLVQTADATWIKPGAGQKPVEKLVPAPDETMLETRARLDSMEEQLADMRNDMKMIMPALTRLAAMPESPQNLPQVQPSAGADPVIETTDTAGNAAVLAPLPLVEPPLQAAPVQLASNSSGIAARDIRFGSHPDKTRVVIDVSGETAFTYDIDNGENILLIGMSGAQWNGPAQAPVTDSPLVASYEAVSDGKGGTQLAVQLRQPAKVLWAQTLSAVDGKPPRIVVDIAPQ